MTAFREAPDCSNTALNEFLDPAQFSTKGTAFILLP